MRKALFVELTARLLIFAAALALGWKAHPLVTAAVLFLTPCLSEAMRALSLRWTGALAAVMVALGVWLGGSGMWLMALALVWAAAAAVMDGKWVKQPIVRILGWMWVSIAILVSELSILCGHYDGALFHGLAMDFAGMIDRSRNANTVLLTAYQLGWARLDESMQGLPALNLFGMTVLLPQMRTELLNSLRATVEFALQEQLPVWMVTYWGVTGALVAWLPSAIVRLRGGEGEFPPMRSWHMDDATGRGAALLVVFGLMRYMTGSLAVYQAANMASAAFNVIFGLQGLCLAVWWLRERPSMALMAVFAAAMLLPMLPTALMLLGLFDQFADPRVLRAKDDIEGGQTL